MYGPARWFGRTSKAGMTRHSAEPMSDAARVVLVWDVPIRLFHWLIAALVAAAYVTWRLSWMVWHGRIGDALLALLLFRLLWGFFGSETARFSRFWLLRGLPFNI